MKQTIAQRNSTGMLLALGYKGWRYEAFDSVSYNAMMLRFWKRLRPSSWYSDTAFLRAGAR